MLTPQTANEVRSRAFELAEQPNGKGVGRALRRFLEQSGAIEPHGPRTLGECLAEPKRLSRVIVQAFCQSGQGYSARQVLEIAKYRGRMYDAQRASTPAGLIEQFPFADLGSYNSPADIRQTFVLSKGIDEMTVAELQKVVGFVFVLAANLAEVLPGGSVLAGVPDYQYRGLPCNIAPDSELWTVCGTDVRSGGGGSGVLEWCHNEEDAKTRLALMQEFPERFPEVYAQRYAKSFATTEPACEA